MKTLISVTPREFKRHFSEIMGMCTDICITTNFEITVITSEKKNSKIYTEIAKVTPVKDDVKYDYNYEFLKKYGIKIDNRINRIESAIANAYKAVGMSKDAVENDARLINQIAKELINQFGLIY